MTHLRKKVLLTGATGYIAGQLLPELRERYDLRLIDVRSTNREGDEVPGVEIVDLLEKHNLNFGMKFEETADGVRVTDPGTPPNRNVATVAVDDDEE